MELYGLFVVGINFLQISLINAKSFYNDYVCWENRLDFIIQLENGQLFAFRHDIIWQLGIYKNRLYSIYQYNLRDLFPNLPNDAMIAFTMPLLDDRIEDRLFAIPGFTMFIDPPKYYLYHNLNWKLTDTIQYWESDSFLDNRFVATLHNTSLLLIAKNGILPDAIKKMITGQVFIFDSDQFPEWIGIFEIRNKKGIDWLRLRQLIPINPGRHYSQSNYLAIFDYGQIIGQYYCITMIDKDNINGDCLNHSEQLTPISKIFDCPRIYDNLKSNNSLYKLWKLSNGLPLHLIIIICSAILFALLLLNTLYLINSIQLLLRFTEFGERILNESQSFSMMTTSFE